MKLLTVDNTVFELDEQPETFEDVRYCVLEYSTEDKTDYYFKPLIFLETFNDLKMDLKIKNQLVSIPLEWSIVCAEEGQAEVIPLVELDDRPLSAFTFNPLKGYLPNYEPIEIVNVFSEIRWYVPKMKNGQFLAIPLTMDPSSNCIFITHQKNVKVPEVLNVSWLVY